MLKKIILLGLVASILPGCFVMDQLLAPPPPVKQESLQEKSEKTVKAYVNQGKGDSEYAPFGFSEIKIIKPVQLAELEKLQKTTPKPEAKIDSLKQLIEAKNIERTIELEHFFTLKEDESTVHVLESKFILNDTLGIKDVQAQILLEMDKKYEDALIYYFNEYTIFLAETYYSSKQLSKNFYDFFKARLEEIEGISAKSDFLEHTIELCYYVKKNGTFDPDVILERNVSAYIWEERTDIHNYSPLEFSTLFEKPQAEPEQGGYYFFHKFMGSYENQLDTNVVMVEFSEYYEINGIYQMERPFDTYFKH
ncbi:MAG: hypothetical protein MI810_15795 [Flavobacteriales bacterium]|nr:hypothetical protein [Flavobacteriales bacterium]